MNASLDSLRAALREQRAPEPSTDLLPRILASRAAGVRVVLPGDPGRRLMPRKLAAVGAAVVVISLAVASWLTKPQRPIAAGAEDMYASLLRGTVLSPSAGGAQEEASGARSPRYALIEQVASERVTAGTWTYESQTTTDDVLTQKSGRLLRVTVAPRRYGEATVWVLMNHDDGAGEPYDTTYIAPITLRPLRYATRGKRAVILQEFAADSVAEAIDVTGPRARSLRARERLPVPPKAPLLPGWRLTDVGPLLQGLPLHRGWRGSVYRIRLVSNASRIPVFVPLDLRVRGSKRITVSAGTFDCWDVEAREGDERATIWVSKDRHWIVKVEQRWSDVFREQMLVSYTSPPAP